MGGHVATHLDLRPKLTIADLIRDGQGMISPEILRTTYLTRHDRGVQCCRSSTPRTTHRVLGRGCLADPRGVLAPCPTSSPTWARTSTSA
jgi:hypothetical protein